MSASHKAIVLFYRYFVPSECPEIFNANAELYVDRLQVFQRELCRRLGCKGRILLSVEGINGTLSAVDASVIQEYISTMRSFHLIRDCGMPDDDGHDDDEIETPVDDHADDEKKYKFFQNVDWKESSVDGMEKIEPFPDLKVSIVKEIVSTGGIVPVNDIPNSTGKHLSPTEFHNAISTSEKKVVLIDVRNTFEHDIGHFVLPDTGEAAMNPEMVTFSSFDNNFCAKHADYLKDKKVLMYCTGGIRCEKASVMLRKRGVEDVNQLSGGIHRYLETYGNDGHYKGLNFVFDQRVAMKPDPTKPQNEIVGRCTECSVPYDEICGSRVCTVCRDLVLICPTCQTQLREYHCRRHSAWKDCYFTFLEVFDVNELTIQNTRLGELRDSLVPAAEYRNQRRTLARQMEKISEQIKKLERGEAIVNRKAPRRCRTCMDPSPLCDGRCWGFWKLKAACVATDGTTEPILPLAVGDVVEPGDDWNPLKLGDTTNKDGTLKRGKVIEIKGWSGEDEDDCAVVSWNDPMPKGRNEAKVQPRIYRWGVLSLNGQRRYDLRKVNEGS